MIQLRFTSGPQQGRVQQIAGALATIGRSPSCDIVLDDNMASGIHATLEMVPAGYIVSDQQSTNGTMLNGQRIWRALMRVGDELVVGGTGLKVEASDGFAATIMPGVLSAGAAPRIDAGKFEPVMQTVFAAGPAAAPASAPAPSMEAAVLEILGPGGAGVRTLPIPKSGLVIGRLPECDVVLDDPLVSRRHCSVAFGPAGAIITDLESSGGTFLGETKLERGGQAKVTPADIVKVGNHSLRVRPPRPGSIRQPVPAPPPGQVPTRHYLEVFEGAPPQKVELFTGQGISVGRLPTSSIVLVDPYCSGQHCEIKLTPDGPVLTDIGSRNGTFVNPAGTELKLPINTPKLLRPNEAFRIGAVKMRVLVIQPNAPETDYKQKAVAMPQMPPQTPPSRPTPSSRRLVMDAAAAQSVRAEPDLPSAQLPKSLRGAKLVFVSGPRAGTALAEVPLEKTHISIGRRDENDITIDDRTVSTRHCVIVAEERGFVLYDHGSTNGTFVGGERVRGERILVNRDLIRIGVDAVAEFILQGNAAGTFFAQNQSADMFEPKFLVRGAVLKQPRLSIGRDAASDLFLDDPSIARSAAEIVFAKMKFTARSLAPKALAVNGRVTSEVELKTGDELQLGPFSIRIEVSGARLTLFEHENQSIVDGNASWARDEEDPSQAPVVAEAAVQSFVGSKGLMSSLPGLQFKTMFAADAAQLAELAPKREKKKGAPKWKATSDLLADRTRSGAMFVGLACAAVVLGVVVAGGNAAFLDGALSEGHDSQHFQQAASEHNLKPGCASCHQPGVAVQSERCQACHVGFAPRRTQAMGKDHVQAGLRCSSCHVEHKGAMSGQALVARTSCSFSACHGPSNPPHQKYNPAAENTPFVKSVYTDPKKKELHFPTGTQEQMQLAIHRIHVGVNRKCMACHVQSDGVTPAATATGSCFRCHDAPGVRAAMNSQPGGDDSQCLGCHMIHDKSMGDPANVGVARAPTPQKRGGPWTGGVSGAKTRKLAGATLGSLFFLVGAFGWVYFGKRVRRVAKLALVPAEDEKKTGGPTGSKAPGELVDGKPAIKLKVNVNKEKCVGCACCVNACPTTVLEIVNHKSTVVKEENCTSCRACEQVCPSGALTMAADGEPPRLIDLPDLDPYYQTNVPGLYLIGEAAGKSLVKNAANLGKVTVDHMVKATGLKPGDAQKLGADVEVVAIGTGPGGLSAALTARSYGLSYACIDKARVYASTIQWCPKGKEFLSEPVDVKNISLLPVPDNCTKEQMIELWDKVMGEHGLELRLSEEVLDVKRDGATGVFTVTTSKGIIKCLKIVLSPGTRGNPRKLGVPGQELEKVSYMLVDPAEHQNHHLLVVGGGDSAVECAMALAGQPGNVVTLSYRKDKFARIKARNQERIDQHAKEGKIKIIFNSSPGEVRDGAVVLKIEGGEKQELKNDFVYCLLGADLPMVWLQQLGITYVKKPEGWNPGPTDQIVIQAPAIAA